LVPHLRILLDLPVERGLVRRFADAGSVNRMDTAGVAFHRRVRDAYHALVGEEPAGWAVVDADRGADLVAADVRTAVFGRLSGSAAPRPMRMAPGPPRGDDGAR
jgi:dTMP kinase